eukprot:1969807-Amphidinium_carterae.1
MRLPCSRGCCEEGSSMALQEYACWLLVSKEAGHATLGQASRNKTPKGLDNEEVSGAGRGYNCLLRVSCNAHVDASAYMMQLLGVSGRLLIAYGLLPSLGKHVDVIGSGDHFQLDWN